MHLKGVKRCQSPYKGGLEGTVWGNPDKGGQVGGRQMHPKGKTAEFVAVFVLV